MTKPHARDDAIAPTPSYRWQFCLVDPQTGSRVQCDAIWHNGSCTITPPLGCKVCGLSLIQVRVDTPENATRFMVCLGAQQHELNASQKVQQP